MSRPPKVAYRIIRKEIRVAGLMGNPIGYKGVLLIADMDTLSETGLYVIDEPTNGTINNWSGLGQLISFATSGYYKYFSQIFIHKEGLIAFRVSGNGGVNWTAWKQL